MVPRPKKKPTKAREMESTTLRPESSENGLVLSLKANRTPNDLLSKQDQVQMFPPRKLPQSSIVIPSKNRVSSPNLPQNCLVKMKLQKPLKYLAIPKRKKETVKHTIKGLAVETHILTLKRLHKNAKEGKNLSKDPTL